jgi:hypothetical protein
MEQAGGAMQDPASYKLETAPSQTNNAPRRRLRFGQNTPWIATWPDFFFAAFAMAAYVLWICCFRYRGLLGEDDLYRVLVGLMDGARSGAHLAAESQYGKAFSFGYIAALYRFVSPQILEDPQRLIALINAIGFWAAAADCFCFWLLAWMLYGLRSATVALIVFTLSPMMLELGTSGHPILPAFALLAAGSLCLLFPADGVRAVLLAFLGSLLLLAAIATRAEVGLALPFVVLARADFGSFSCLIKSTGLRAAAAVLVTAAFLLLKWIYVDSTPGSAHWGSFLAQFIRFKDIPIGVFVFAFSCGIVTVFAGLIAAVSLVRSLARAIARCTPTATPSASAQRIALLHSATGPLLLIVPALFFWIANPRPGRHFILCLAGISVLIGGLISRALSARPIFVYALAFGIVAGNQAMGALTGPFILKYAPSKLLVLPGNIHHLPRGVPTGSSFGYHRAFVAEQSRTTVFAKNVQNPCDEKTLVLSLDATQIFSDLYSASAPPIESWIAREQHLGRFPFMEAHIRGRTVLVLSENEGWPRDAAADALADPAFRDYKLMRDPNVLSIYDRVVIPPSRIAHLGCVPD